MDSHRSAPASPDHSTPAKGGASPFASRDFALVWPATVISNIGLTMNDMGTAWLMTSLTSSPFLIGLAQAAGLLPVFLLALPAGALSDILDKRRLLIAVQIAVCLTAAVYAIITVSGAATPSGVVALAFLLGTGTAFTAINWQAIVPRLVPREDIAAAVTVNSLGINLSRAIGPGLGGVAVATIGVFTPMAVNALCAAAVIVMLLKWRGTASMPQGLPPEHVLGAMQGGLRYAFSSPPLLATFLRAVTFFAFAGPMWTLLPILARGTLGGGPGLYGSLLACLGAGGVVMALVLPRMRRFATPDQLVTAATLGIAVTLAVLAVAKTPAPAAAACLIGGASWITALSSLNVSAQMALPDWVRARGLSLFQMIYFGSVAGGALFWGRLAGLWGVPAALAAASALGVLSIPLVRRARLDTGRDHDLTPSSHWPEPLLTEREGSIAGPVMVTAEYRIEPPNRAAFLVLMAKLEKSRRRGGAYSWSLFEDAAEPGRYLEAFIEPSWTDHLRHHGRVTGADRQIQDAIEELQGAGAARKVTHWIGTQLPSTII